MPTIKKSKILRSKTEDDLHFIVKGLIFKQIKERGGHPRAEMALTSLGWSKIVDIADMKTGEIYEVERTPTKEYIQNIKANCEALGIKGHVVDLRTIPKDLKKSIDQLSTFLWIAKKLNRWEIK
jgi:hypothetical protein